MRTCMPPPRVSAPLDLMAAGAALGQGLNRIYTRMFLATLREKSLAKLERFRPVRPRQNAGRAQSARNSMMSSPRRCTVIANR